MSIQEQFDEFRAELQLQSSFHEIEMMLLDPANTALIREYVNSRKIQVVTENFCFQRVHFQESGLKRPRLHFNQFHGFLGTLLILVPQHSVHDVKSLMRCLGIRVSGFKTGDWRKSFLDGATEYFELTYHMRTDDWLSLATMKLLSVTPPCDG